MEHLLGFGWAMPTPIKLRFRVETLQPLFTNQEQAMAMTEDKNCSLQLILSPGDTGKLVNGGWISVEITPDVGQNAVATPEPIAAPAAAPAPAVEATPAPAAEAAPVAEAPATESPPPAGP